MPRCSDCDWKYPDALLHRIYTAGEGWSKPICGICALDRTNEVHGVVIDKFTGEQAESIRQAAMWWRKRHPNDAPES